MPTQLPDFVRKVDDSFVTTWYEIREEAIDNILDATVMWLALREHNSLTPQTGGEIITRTIRYGKKDKQNIAAGKTLKQSVAKRETMAWWDWKYIAIDINRSLFDDQKNAGPSKIKDYVTTRLSQSRDDIIQGLERDLFSWANAFEDQINGLFDVVPVNTYDAAGMPQIDPEGDAPTWGTGTWGNQQRSNDWWQTVRPTGTPPASPETNLRSDMTFLFNRI